MNLSIDRRLNIVIPLDQGEGDQKRTLYVYSTPLPLEVFRRHWLLFSKTFAQIYNEGLHMTAGPRVAAMALRDLADQRGVKEEVEMGVFAEMQRLSFVITPTESRGWQNMLLADAVGAKIISEEDMEEVENILTFFTVTSSMHRGATRRKILEGAAKLWDAQITSQSCSEFTASLPKLTVTASSGARIKAAS